MWAGLCEGSWGRIPAFSGGCWCSRHVAVSLPSLPLLSHGLLRCVFTISLLFASRSPCPPPLKTEQREKGTCRLKISMNRRRRESRWRGWGWIPRSRAPGECLAATLSPDSGADLGASFPSHPPKRSPSTTTEFRA